MSPAGSPPSVSVATRPTGSKGGWPACGGACAAIFECFVLHEQHDRQRAPAQSWPSHFASDSICRSAPHRIARDAVVRTVICVTERFHKCEPACIVRSQPDRDCEDHGRDSHNETSSTSKGFEMIPKTPDGTVPNASAKFALVRCPSAIRRCRGELWCRLRDSNPRPRDYKSRALPAELSRRNVSGRRGVARKSFRVARPVHRRFHYHFPLNSSEVRLWAAASPMTSPPVPWSKRLNSLATFASLATVDEHRSVSRGGRGADSASRCRGVPGPSPHPVRRFRLVVQAFSG
jgi:hypothetical protein